MALWCRRLLRDSLSMKQTQQREKSKRHKSEHGRGHVYLQHGAWYLQYYQSEMRDGETVRARRSVKLADKDCEHGTATCDAVRLLRQKELTKVSTAPTVTTEDVKVVDFWETQYLPSCEKEWKGTGDSTSLRFCYAFFGLDERKREILRQLHVFAFRARASLAAMTRPPFTTTIGPLLIKRFLILRMVMAILPCGGCDIPKSRAASDAVQTF